MSLEADSAMFWRFGPVLSFAKTSWVAQPILDEARDEIESIARHTKGQALRDKCQRLLNDTRDAVMHNSPTEQVVNEILAAVIRAKVGVTFTTPGPDEILPAFVQGRIR